MGTTQSSEGKDQEDAWTFSRQNLDTREKTRKVSLPKIWRAPYGEFTKELPRENSKLRATSSFAILSNRDPNERFNRALRSIKDNRKDFFSGRKECDPTKVICSDALYSLAAAMRFARLSQSGETAHPEVAALKLKLTDVDLSHCTGVLYRYEELGYTANPFSKESLLPFSHVRALLPLALGGGSTRKSLTNASNSADETREELKMFQAAQILVSRSPDNTVNIMLDNGEFLPAIPLQSVSFADDEEKNGWYTPLYCRASKVESSSVEDDGAAGSTAPEISVAARVTMGRRKDHGFFAAGASARARLSNLVGDVKVEIPPGTVIAKCMIQVKNVFGTAVATAREIIDVMASATMPKIHQRNIVRLNDAESTSEESPFWHDQQKRCFVFLIWVHDEKSFLGQFNDDYDRKAEELHKQLDAAFDFHFNENSLASSAGKDMGVCVFPSGGASNSVTMTPKDHEGVLYTIPLRYLLANMRRSGKKPSPFAKEVKKHLEQRQAMVLAKRAEDANTEGQGQGGEDAENTEGDGEEYEGVLLDSRQPRKTPYEESVYDVLIPRERAIVHETYRLSIQLGGMERAAMGDSQSGSASSSTEGGWCSSTGKDGFLDVVELDFPLAKGGTSLPPILQNRTKCVILKEAKSASSIGPLTYTNPALVTPTGVTKETWEELRMKTVDNCLFYMGRDGKTYMKRGAVEGAGNSHKHQAPENTYLFSDMDQNSYAVVTSKKGRRGSDYDTDRLMRGSATEADQDDKFFDKNKTNGEQDDAAGAWVRVMPCLRQGDAVRVRDYSNISLPSRIISCNDNTYDVRLSDGSLRNSIKRSDMWLEPTIELKLSALAVDSLQENEELYGSAESSRSFYPTEPLPKHAIVILRLNQELSTDGPEELRNVLALGQIVDTSGEDPDRYYASVNSSAGQMPGEYSDDGLKPYKTFEYTIKLLNEETSSFPKMHSMAEWKSLMETIKPGKAISTLYYTKLRRGYDFQVYYPLPTKQVLKKNEIDAMEGCRVFLANEFKPAFVASPHNGDEGRSNMDPGEGSLSVECRAQFDMQETSNVEHNAASNMLASLWTPQPKVVHWAYDVRESHYGFVLEDVATIIEEPFSLSSTSTSIDKRYTVEFTDENNRARRFNVPTWELWPINPSSDASPPSTEGALVRIKVRGDGSGKKSFRYYVGKVEAIDRSMGHNFVYTVRVRTSKYTNIKTPGTALAMTFDVLKENIQTVIDLKKGDEVMCSLYDKGLCWARYNNNGVDRAELRECSIVRMKVPKAMQNRWLSLPSTRRVCAARNAGAYSVTDEGDFTIDDMGTMLTNAVYEEQLHEPVNSQDRDNGDYGLYDYDVMLVSTGEVLKNVDPLRLALPTPGARVSCGVNLNDLRTGVIVSSLPISGRENEDEDGKPNHVFVRDNQNRNYLVENCLQAGEDLLPPSPGDLLSVLDNIPSVGEMLGLDDEDENQNVAPTFNPNMVITDRRGLAAPEYEYVIELDNLIVRSPLENDSRKKHVGSFFSEVANSSTAKISLNRLHGIEIDDSLYGYVDSDDEETPEAESSGILTDLKELPLVLLIHPYESEERISAPNKSSSTFLGAVKDQIVESLPQFQGVYNPDVEERAYRVGNIVSVPIADSVQDTLEPQYEYFILTKPENKDVAVENAQLYSDLRPGKSWELWEPKYSGTWKQSLDNEENSNSCVCYSLKGPYVGALPSLYGDLDDYKVGDGQNGSTQSNQKQPFTINREIEENGARPLCKVQVWEVFVGNPESYHANNIGNSRSVCMPREEIMRSIVSGADFYVTAVEHSNDASIWNANKSMTYIRALGAQVDVGGHAGFIHNRMNSTVKGPLSISAVNEYMHDIQAEKARDDPWTDFRSVVWKHKDGDAAPMFCFVQPPRTRSEPSTMIYDCKGVNKSNSKERYEFENSPVFKQFLWLHGCYHAYGIFDDPKFGSRNNVVDVLKGLWQWPSEISFRKQNFVARVALRRIIGLMRASESNRMTHTYKNCFVLQNSSTIWSRSKNICNKYSLRNNLQLGMHAWVRRTVKGTVLLRNNGTYDVKRDTASALKAIENGMNVERPITIPASHVEAVRTPESKEYDNSSLVELFVQARNCLRSLNLNYTDIGIHGAKALRILLEGVSSSYSDADNAGGSDESAERVDPLDTFYQNFSTFKADKTIRLRQPLITTLALRACGLGMDGLNELSRAMSSNNSITALDLGMNNLGDEGVFCVARVLAKQPSLRRLDLRGNAITGIGAQHLARGIAQFQIGVITNSHPALDVQLQDKLFLAGVPYKAIQLCEGDHILVSRETQNNYLHCQVKEIIDDDLIKVEPEGFTGAEFPTVNCSRVTLPWSYLIEHNYQVRIKYERHVKVLSVSGLNRKGYEKAQVQYITQKTYRMGEVVIKKDVTGEEFYWHIRTGKKLGNVKDTSNGITTNHQAGTITFEVEDSENEEYFEMVPFKFLRNKPLNNFSNEYDKSTTFDYQIFRKGYKRAVVFAPLARVFRATESYDVKMFAENHQVVNKIPAAKTFTQPIDSGEYIELSVPRCRIRSLVGSYVGLGAVVEVQPRGRVCRLEELILDGNDVADLLVTKGFGRMDGLIALIHSVAGRSTMRHLSLRGTALGDRGAKIIAKCLAHPHNRCHGGGWGLESLDVSQCQIRVDGLRNLVAMSSANSWLKEVIFAGNPSTKFIIEAAKSPLPGRGNNAGVKETLETTIERKMKFSENLRNVRNSTNATLGGAGSKIDSEKANGDNFFPTAYACVLLGLSVLPKNSIDVVNVHTGIRFEDEVQYRHALLLRHENEFQYRQFAKTIQTTRIKHIKELKLSFSKKLTDWTNSGTIGELPGLKTASEKMKKVAYSLITTGRILNHEQVSHCCDYFIHNYRDFLQEIGVGVRRAKRKHTFTIGGLERACGLSEQEVILDTNSAHGTALAEGSGVIPFFKMNLKAEQKLGGVIGADEEFWTDAVELLESEWKSFDGKDHELLGTKPVTDQEDDADDEEEQGDKKPEPENKEAQSTEEEKAAAEGKKEPEIASGDPEKVNEVKWHFPVAYYDNLDVLFLATERKDMQNPEELQDDENNVLYHYGAGCALKYDVPLLVPNATHKHKKMVRQRHLVRIGAGMAALLKNEDESIRQFLGRHDLSLSEFGEMVDNFNLQLFDLSKITV